MNPPIEPFIEELTRFEFAPKYNDDRELLKSQIFSLLTPDWFRFGPISEEISTMLHSKISEMVDLNVPIEILNAYGGYKNYQVDTSPHIDYAEVFHLSFSLKTLLRICEIYKPGIHLEYSGDSHAACYANNIKKASVDTYLSEFNHLLDKFQTLIPPNFTLTHKDFPDFYNYDDLARELDTLIEKEDLSDPKNVDQIAHYYKNAKRNFCFDGEIDYTSLSSDEKETLIKQSVVKTHKWYDIDFQKRSDYFNALKISFCNIKNFPEAYCVRSIHHLPCPGFWQGKGVVEARDGKYHAVILPIDEYLKKVEGLTSIDAKFPSFPIPSLTSLQML